MIHRRARHRILHLHYCPPTLGHYRIDSLLTSRMTIDISSCESVVSLEPSLHAIALVSLTNSVQEIDNLLNRQSPCTKSQDDSPELRVEPTFAYMKGNRAELHNECLQNRSHNQYPTEQGIVKNALKDIGYTSWNKTYVRKKAHCKQQSRYNSTSNDESDTHIRH